MLSLIAVIGEHRELGNGQELLWHVPGDLPRFKKITTGHPIIMGRKTYESIGKSLPERTNIIITHNDTFTAAGVKVVHTLDEALSFAEKSEGSEEIFVIGGGKIFEGTIKLADRLYLTLVDREAEADTFFPPYPEFDKVVAQDRVHVDGFNLTYLTLEKSH